VTPSTRLTNALLYTAGWLAGIGLSMATALAFQLAGTDDIVWRPVMYAGMTTGIGTFVPYAASMGLPRFGHEATATLVSQIGQPQAQAALEKRAEHLEAENVSPH
jgi:hypothetical protein